MVSWAFQKKRMPIRSPIVRWPQTPLKQYLLDALWLASKRDIGMVDWEDHALGAVLVTDKSIPHVT